MRKSDFIRVIADKNNITLRQATLFFDSTLDALGDLLASGDSIMFAGFGSFTIKEHDEREARAPRTGETVIVPAKKTIKFKASKTLTDRLNS